MSTDLQIKNTDETTENLIDCLISMMEEYADRIYVEANCITAQEAIAYLRQFTVAAKSIKTFVERT